MPRDPQSVGDADLAGAAASLRGQARRPFDLVLLACKAYDSTARRPPSRQRSIGHRDPAAVERDPSPRSMQARFGAAHVLGGQCVISTTLDPDGRILHLATLIR